MKKNWAPIKKYKKNQINLKSRTIFAKIVRQNKRDEWMESENI